MGKGEESKKGQVARSVEPFASHMTTFAQYLFDLGRNAKLFSALGVLSTLVTFLPVKPTVRELAVAALVVAFCGANFNLYNRLRREITTLQLERSTFQVQLLEAKFRVSTGTDAKAWINVQLILEVHNRGEQTTLVLKEADLNRVSVERHFQGFFHGLGTDGARAILRRGYLDSIQLSMHLATLDPSQTIPEPLVGWVILRETYTGEVKIPFAAAREIPI